MKILATTDLHIAEQHNKYRPNVYKDILDKLMYCLKRAAALDVDMFVVAGDWFHTTKIPYWLLDETLEVFLNYNEHNFDLYRLSGIAGQHDKLHHGTYRRGPFAFLSYAINDLGIFAGDKTWAHRWFDRSNDSEFKVEWIPYGCKPESNKSDIIIIHDMLVPQPVPFEHIIFEDFIASIPSKPSLVISGDYHPGFLPCLVNKTLFVNPGALTRINRDEENRAPKLAIIEWEKDHWEAIYEEIPHRKNVFQAVPETLIDVEMFTSMFVNTLLSDDEEQEDRLKLDLLDPKTREFVEELLEKAREKLGY